MSGQASEQIIELWDEDNKDSDFQKAMDELYFYADTIYCRAPPTGWFWELTHSPGTDPRIYLTSPTPNLIENVNNVQGCRDLLEATYTNYVVDFDDLDQLVEFLNHFGELEKDYDCSGVCEYKPVFYFYDSAKGFPERKCEDPIAYDILIGEVMPIGFGFVIISAVLLIIALIHCGFFCRKDNVNNSKYMSKKI